MITPDEHKALYTPDFWKLWEELAKRLPEHKGAF